LLLAFLDFAPFCHHQKVPVVFFSSRRRHTRSKRDWSSDVCSSDLDNAAREANTDGVVTAEEAAAVETANQELAAAKAAAKEAINAAPDAKREELNAKVDGLAPATVPTV